MHSVDCGHSIIDTHKRKLIIMQICKAILIKYYIHTLNFSTFSIHNKFNTRLNENRRGGRIRLPTNHICFLLCIVIHSAYLY